MGGGEAGRRRRRWGRRDVEEGSGGKRGDGRGNGGEAAFLKLVMDYA